VNIHVIIYIVDASFHTRRVKWWTYSVRSQATGKWPVIAYWDT